MLFTQYPQFLLFTHHPLLCRFRYSSRMAELGPLGFQGYEKGNPWLVESMKELNRQQTLGMGFHNCRLEAQLKKVLRVVFWVKSLHGICLYGLWPMSYSTEFGEWWLTGYLHNLIITKTQSKDISKQINSPLNGRNSFGWPPAARNPQAFSTFPDYSACDSGTKCQYKILFP